MKGIANITVKSADGRIKTRREEHNTITTAYKDKIAGQIANLKWGRSAFLSTSADDFKAVWMHGETLDDLCDIQTPLLVGGQDAKASGVSWQYAAPLNASVDEDTKTISNTWAWSIGEATTIKALSLHNSAVASQLNIGSWVTMVQKVIELPNDKVWIPGRYGRYSSGSGASKYVASQGKYDIKLETSSFRLLPKNRVDCSALPLYNGEFLAAEEAASTNQNILFFPNSATADTVLTVVSDENFANGTNTAARTFTMAQFEDFTSGQWMLSVMPTEYADWIFMSKNATSTTYVYQLPRTATSGTISKVTTITGVSSVYCVIIGNMCIFNPNNTEVKKVFSSKDSGTWRVDEAQLANGAIGGAGQYCVLKMFYRNGDRSAFLLGGSGDCDDSDATIATALSASQIHNTILNLSSPLELAAGDTLSITYKIVIDDSETA